MKDKYYRRYNRAVEVLTMKRIILRFVVVLMLIFTSAACNASEKWIQVGEWYTGVNVSDSAILNNNTETFKAPSKPWGFGYAVEKINPNMPMMFSVVLIPTNKTQYSEENLVIGLFDSASGSYRTYNESPENYLAIMTFNCRWTIAVFKIEKAE